MPKNNFSRKSALLGALCAVLLLGLLYAGLHFAGLTSPVAEPFRFEGAGSDSPEAAAQAYIEGLRNADLDQMLRAFAVETYAAHYDLESMIRRMQSWSPAIEYLPDGREPFARLNLLNRVSEIRRQIRRQILILLELESWNGTEIGSIIMTDDEQIREFMETFDPDLSKLETLSVLEILEPEDLGDALGDPGLSERYHSQTNQNNLTRQMEFTNADDWRHLTAHIGWDGEEYYLFFELLRYGGQWYVGGFSGNLGHLMGLSSTAGGLAKAP